MTNNYAISQLSQITNARVVPGIKIPLVDPTDTTTPPSGPGGSDKWATLGQIFGAAFFLFPSNDTSGVTDAANINAAITALPSSIGVIKLMPTGTWYINAGQISMVTGQYIEAEGCYIVAKGAGSVFRWVDSSTYLSRTIQGAGMIGFPIIDGTSTTGNSCAIQAGDILELAVYVQAQNFTAGTTSKGVWLSNAFYWAEQSFGRIYIFNCTAGVVFDVPSGYASTTTGSFDRANLEIYINQAVTSQDGVVFQNGSYIDDIARLHIGGNFQTATGTPTSALLRITGLAGATRGDTGVYSHLGNGFLSIGAECGIVTGTLGPVTIFFGAAGNYISAPHGSMNFDADGNNFQSSNSAGLTQFNYAGTITGDTVLFSNYTGEFVTVKMQVYGGVVNPSIITADSNGLLQITDPAGMTSWIQQTQSSSVTANTVGNTSTIGFLGWLTAPANEPVASTKYRYSMHGTLSTEATPGAATCDIRWGAGTTGTLLMSIVTGTSAPALTASLTNVPIQIEGEVEFTSTTAAIGWMKMTWRNSNTATTAATVALVQVNSPVTSLPVSSTEFLQVNWTWVTANASNTITIYASSFERVA
jgi:hypothetical protein